MFPSGKFHPMTDLILKNKHVDSQTYIWETGLVRLNNNVQFFSELEGIFSYFRKFFNCSLKFNLDPGNIRNLEFFRILRKLNLKEAGSDRCRVAESGVRSPGGERQQQRWSLKQRGEKQDGARGRAWDEEVGRETCLSSTVPLLQLIKRI